MFNKIIISILATLSLSTGVFAGEKTVNITVPSVQGIHFADSDQNVSLYLPKWDSRDQSGNVVPAYKLRKVKVKMALDANMYLTITNTLSVPRGYWKWNIGPSPVLSLDGFKDDTDFMPSRLESIEGIAYKNMGAGETKYYPLMSSYFYEFEKDISTPRELRMFTGTGSVPINLILSKYEDRSNVAGHGWSFTEDLVLNSIVNQPGVFVPSVTYIFDDSATEFLKMKEIRVPIPEIRFTQDLPYTTVLFDGFNLDPSRIVSTEVTLRPNCWYYDGIENTGTIPMPCGGYAMFSSEIWINGKWAVNGGVYRTVGSGNANLAAFDGTLDFDGQSGTEGWSSSNSSMPTVSLFDNEETLFHVSPSDIVGPSKQLFFTVTQNESNYSPIPTFSWWDMSVISGEVLIKVRYR